MTTCKNCKFKILMPLTQEAVDMVKAGKGIPPRQAVCTFNPPIPVPVVIMVQTPEGVRPMQQIVAAYAPLTDDSQACAKYEFTPPLQRKPKLEAVT